MRTRPLVSLSLLSLLALAGCSGTSHWYFGSEQRDHEWGYAGEIGPERWGELDPSFRLAAEGRAQSPIDIVPAATTRDALPPLEFHYRSTDAHWINNGHTLEHDHNEGNWLVWQGRAYHLAQYHLHAPSEHTVDGLHAPAELHFVHRDDEGRVLVLALMMAAGDDHPEVSRQVAALPLEPGDESYLPIARDPTDLLPDDRGYWVYEGSFTTPPCTEGVTWIVLRSPVRAPVAALRRIGEILGRNNRPVMPLNGRVVRASP